MSQIFSPLFEGILPILLVLASLPATLYLSMRCYRSEQERMHQRDLIENLHEGIYRSTLDGKQISANKALVKLNGYASEEELLASVGDIAREWYVVPSRRDEFRSILFSHGFVEDFVSEIYRHKTRERIWISESARLVRQRRTGKPLYYEGSVREITEAMNRQNADERLRKLSSQIPGGLFQFIRRHDGTYSMAFVSDGFRELYCLDAQEPLPTAAEFTAMVHPLDRHAFTTNIAACIENNAAWNQEYRVILRDGTQKWLQINAKTETIENGVIWHGYVSDITARKQTEDEIEKLAFFDMLTGLPNRRTFLARMEQAIEDCHAHGHKSALLFVDLDNFKTLNDTRGHDIGDAFLIQAAERLKNCIGQRGIVARIGGDEFVVILQDAGTDMAAATRSALLAGNQMLAALREDFHLGGFSHRSSASIGVVTFDGNAASANEIFKQADAAMYQAKSAGRNGLALYDQAVINAQAKRYRLLDDLKTALSEGSLDLHFQPQMGGSGHVEGAEALCRWHHPRLGMLLPKQFVPLTEQFGLIRDFTNLVLDKGMAELARWQKLPALAGIRLSVNVNVRVLACTNFISDLAERIENHGIDPRLLTLELTESVMTKDPRLLARHMLVLRKLGVRLSLDDFGTGYSSLAYLKRMPFDELKIDGSFIADMEGSESDRQLVKSILGTARTLKLAAVAGHITTKGQEALLRSYGCDYFQGELYSLALPADDFVAFAENHIASRRQERRLA